MRVEGGDGGIWEGERGERGDCGNGVVIGKWGVKIMWEDGVREVFPGFCWVLRWTSERGWKRA